MLLQLNELIQRSQQRSGTKFCWFQLWFLIESDSGYIPYYLDKTPQAFISTWIWPSIYTSPFLFWRFCILFIPHPLHPVSIDNNTENLNKRRSLFVYLHIADPVFNREYSVCIKLRLAGGRRVILTASGACLIHDKRVRNINNCPPDHSKPLSDKQFY